jgi:DNA polymerase
LSFLDADYSAIEARITCWLAGQEDALQEYRDGVDRYVSMASQIYGIPRERVNKHPQRFVGKSAILGCGFGMGAPKFRVTVKKQGRYELPDGLEFTAVQGWRAKHKKVVAFWYDMERAAKNAILRKGQRFAVGRFIQFLVKDVEGMPFLLMRLPSGRKLSYPKPRLCGDRIAFFGNTIGTNWGDISTWGGSLVENAVQAVAADIMAHGSHNAERAGYEVATLIHDQCLTFHKEGQTPERLIELLTDLPSWGAGLPIAAEGGIVPFYRKD